VEGSTSFGLISSGRGGYGFGMDDHQVAGFPGHLLRRV